MVTDAPPPVGYDLSVKQSATDTDSSVAGRMEMTDVASDRLSGAPFPDELVADADGILRQFLATASRYVFSGAAVAAALNPAPRAAEGDDTEK